MCEVLGSPAIDVQNCFMHDLAIAYHKAGHAVVAYYTKDSQPFRYISIDPQDVYVQHRICNFKREPFVVNQSQLLAMLDTFMGGQAAEALIIGPNMISPETINDIQNQEQVINWMLENSGNVPCVIGNHCSVPNGSCILHQNNNFGDIQGAIEASKKRAAAILWKHRTDLDRLAEALLEHKTLDPDAIIITISENPA